MKYRNTFRVTVIAAALSSLLSFPVFAGSKPDHEIVILYTNDVHCGLDQNIGYAGVALYKKQMQQQTPYVTLVDAGDAIQGEPIGSMTNGEYPIKVMNKVGYDFIIPGNHEFDYGMDVFLNLSKKTDVPYHSATFTDLRTSKTVFDSYQIFNYGDVKIAFVGITTPETLNSSTPTFFMDKSGKQIYSFGEDSSGEKFYELVQTAVDDAHKAGADYIIGVGHVGEDGPLEIWNAEHLIAHISGLDALIDGHSHETTVGVSYKDKDNKDVIVTQTGTKLKHLGKMTIDTDGLIHTQLIDKVDVSQENITYCIKRGDTLQSIARHELGNYKLWKQIADENTDTVRDPRKLMPGMNLKITRTLGVINSEGKAVDPDVDRLIKSLYHQFDGLFSQKVGHLSKPLYAKNANEDWLVRSKETGIGDLIAEAYREKTESDIGFIHGGGIRDNLPAGDITYKDLLKVQPFGNWISKIEIKGADLLDVLEMSVSKYPSDGPFPSLSGVTFTLDATIPSPVKVDDKGCFAGVDGERRVKDVKVNGEPVDLEKSYTMGICEYYALEYGDGFSMFKKANVLSAEVTVDNELFIEYFKNHKNIDDRFYNDNGLENITIKK